MSRSSIPVTCRAITRRSRWTSPNASDKTAPAATSISVAGGGQARLVLSVALPRARVVAPALCAQRGALGLSEVVAALNEGRVEHVIYDSARRYTGGIGPDGSL